MNRKTGELILADIALYMDGLGQQIAKAQTEPLTPKTISKRHIRILLALSISSTIENTWVHASLEQIRGSVAMESGKLYSKTDIRAFTFDLANRGYINHHKHEEHGDIFAILLEGVYLLEMAKENLAPHINESNTPNFYSGMRH